MQLETHSVKFMLDCLQ